MRNIFYQKILQKLFHLAFSFELLEVLFQFLQIVQSCRFFWCGSFCYWYLFEALIHRQYFSVFCVRTIDFKDSQIAVLKDLFDDSFGLGF